MSKRGSASRYVGSLGQASACPLRAPDDNGAPAEIMVIAMHVVDRAIADSMLSAPNCASVRKDAQQWLDAWAGTSRSKRAIIELGRKQRIEMQARTVAIMRAKLEARNDGQPEQWQSG